LGGTASGLTYSGTHLHLYIVLAAPIVQRLGRAAYQSLEQAQRDMERVHQAVTGAAAAGNASLHRPALPPPVPPPQQQQQQQEYLTGHSGTVAVQPVLRCICGDALASHLLRAAPLSAATAAAAGADAALATAAAAPAAARALAHMAQAWHGTAACSSADDHAQR
jgi:hypothetical protein